MTSNQQPESPTLLSLRMLEIMMERDEHWGVSELAAALGVQRGRAHRHLTSLRDAGFLSQNPETRQYGLGWRLVLLGGSVARRSRLVVQARPIMEHLCAQVQQAVVLSQLTDHGVVVTETVSDGSKLTVIFPPGTTYAYNSSAQGKVGLAFANAEQREEWDKLTHEVRTGSTVVERTRLLEQVEETRLRGWATAPDETFDGMNAVAVPVLSAGGLVTATLAIVAPGKVIPADAPLPGQLLPLMQAAARLSTLLGCREDELPPSQRGILTTESEG